MLLIGCLLFGLLGFALVLVCLVGFGRWWVSFVF